MANGDTKTQQYLDVAARGTRSDIQRGCCNTRTQDLIMDVAERIITEEETRAAADRVLQGEIDEIKNNPDVADVVPTYAALQNYDTSTLTDKDIIRVLADETHGGASTYYRWSTSTQSFTYIGEAGDYYTKSQMDTLLDAKQDELTAGDNITIEDESGALVISATDTTYSDFVGTDGTSAGTAGLVPAPATTDAGKFLKADGTWDDAGSAVNVVQTTGTSTTDVMSQNAVTSMVFADPSAKTQVRIGSGAVVNGFVSAAIGAGASATAIASFAFGNDAIASGDYSIALGQSRAQARSAVTFPGGTAPTQGVVQMGLNSAAGWATLGYNNSAYRLLTGLYDPQSAHDAANKQYVDTAVAGATTATINSTDWSDLWQ